MTGGMGFPPSLRMAIIPRIEWPLWVISGHRKVSSRCLLYTQKQTLELSRVTSALCQSDIADFFSA